MTPPPGLCSDIAARLLTLGELADGVPSLAVTVNIGCAGVLSFAAQSGPAFGAVG